MRSWVAGGLVFLSAASVLVLEILALRILAPYVGVTLQTFTGIIGTVLAGIAVGAWLGGLAADRFDPAALLGPVLVGGGILVIATPAIVTAVGPSLGGESAVQIVMLSFIGFFLPAAVLSAVAPIVAKLALRSLEQTGAVVGRLSALGTAGAIFGTFVTGFVLVAALPSRPITWVVGGLLIVIGVVVTVPDLRRWVLVGAVPLLVVALGLAVSITGPCDLETAYFCVQIRVDPDRPTGRELILDTLRHSYVDLEDPAYLGSRYARVIAATIEATQPEGAIDTLYIGGGGFTLPRHQQATRGGTATVLEIDEELVRVVEDRLGLERGPWLSVRVGDARMRLADTEPGGYDVVVGDAFGGPSVPWHLTTVEFVAAIRDRLRPDGIYALNLIDHPPTQFARAETATLLAVFPHVAVIAHKPQLNGERGGNFVLVGSNEPLDQTRLAEMMRDGESVLTGDQSATFAGSALVLRDEYAPVDQLLGRP